MLQMYKYKRTDFIETDLKSQLMESLEHHMVTMETMRKDFEKYRSRLGVVRQEKEKARLELLGKYELHCEKTCLRGFRACPTRTWLYSHERLMEA